jgi:hypothetical protein
MRRFILGGLTAVLLVSIAPAASAAHHPGHHPAQHPVPNPWRGPCGTWHEGERDSGRTTPAIRVSRTRNLIVCLFGKFAPEDLSIALYVADRESHFYPGAANPSGASGVYQHLASCFPGRVSAYLPRSWLAPWIWAKGGPSVFNPYANVVVTLFMVRGSGWGPWSM